MNDRRHGDGRSLGFMMVPGSSVRRIIAESRPAVFEAVRRAYLLHHSGLAVTPPSQFLRVPEHPCARIIALPAYLGGEYAVAGVKWVASFPENIDRDLPRASAVLLLNDCETGYPFACIEASQINAARTAASAVLGAEQLGGSDATGKVAFVGCGVIARSILDFMVARQWDLEAIHAFDRTTTYTRAFTEYTYGLGLAASPAATLEEAILGVDVIVLATNAATPYIRQRGVFSPRQVVLNISLRDVDPVVVAEAHNIVDDVDHCLAANTSVHLTEQALGSRDFIDGTLAQLMLGEVRLGTDRPRIFSPFGLGVLDLAVGMLVHRAAVTDGEAQEIPEFFGELARWGRSAASGEAGGEATPVPAPGSMNT